MDLWRMYQRHAAAEGWRWEQLSLLETEVRGVYSRAADHRHADQVPPS